MGLSGSSTIRKLPPSPVAVPPTEVAKRWPRAVVTNLRFSFWSPVSCTTGKSTFVPIGLNGEPAIDAVAKGEHFGVAGANDPLARIVTK